MRTRVTIRRLARGLLADAGVTQPPVPIEDVAKEAGFEIHTESLDTNLSGFYVREGDQHVIGVNAFHPKTRQRFTIAHELGHAALEEGTSHIDHIYKFRDPRSSTGADGEEVAANAFAAELLMPADWVETMWEARDGALTDDEHIAALAKKFLVSPQAMGIRLSSLGLADL